jgi:hypothetical protein
MDGDLPSFAQHIDRRRRFDAVKQVDFKAEGLAVLELGRNPFVQHASRPAGKIPEIDRLAAACSAGSGGAGSRRRPSAARSTTRRSWRGCRI